MEKPPHVQRMEAEASELADRIGKLRAFATPENSTFAQLPLTDQDLLLAQNAAMAAYASILAARIGRVTG